MPRQGKALPGCLAQAVRVLSVPPVMVAALTLILYRRRNGYVPLPGGRHGAAVCTVAMAVSLLIFH